MAEANWKRFDFLPNPAETFIWFYVELNRKSVNDSVHSAEDDYNTRREHIRSHSYADKTLYEIFFMSMLYLDGWSLLWKHTRLSLHKIVKVVAVRQKGNQRLNIKRWWVEESFANEINDSTIQKLLKKFVKHSSKNFLCRVEIVFLLILFLSRTSLVFAYPLMKFLKTSTKLLHQSLPRSIVLQSMLHRMKLKIYGAWR